MEERLLYLVEFVINDYQPKLEDYDNLDVKQINHYKKYINTYSIPIVTYVLRFLTKDEFGTVHSHTEEIYIKGITSDENDNTIIVYNRIDNKKRFEKLILTYKDYKFIIPKSNISEIETERR